MRTNPIPNPLIKLCGRSRIRSGFTLIELIVVIAIMGILLTIGSLVATDTTNGMKLTEVAQTLTQELARARQYAMTKNREVEFRIYKSDPHTEGDEGFRSYTYGVVEVVTDPNDANYVEPTADNFDPPFVPATRRTVVQQGYEFLDSAPYSTLIDGVEAAVLNVKTGVENRTDGTSVNYVSFTFEPEGGALLDADNDWTLTVVRRQSKDRDGSELKKNFATLQIIPQSGRARLYRP